MAQKQTENVGAKLRELREELGLSQEDWAKLLQVTTNTVARWEREALEPKGAHRKKVEHVLAISQDEKAMDTIKSTLKSEGGLPATAAFLGMLFGVMGALGLGLGLVAPLLKNKSSLLSGILEYAKGEKKNNADK